MAEAHAFKQLALRFVRSDAKGTPSSRMTASRTDYFAYAPMCSDEDCITAFEWAFGYAPAELVRTGGAVLVGPIGGKVKDGQEYETWKDTMRDRA